MVQDPPKKGQSMDDLLGEPTTNAPAASAPKGQPGKSMDDLLGPSFPQAPQPTTASNGADGGLSGGSATPSGASPSPSPPATPQGIGYSNPNNPTIVRAKTPGIEDFEEAMRNGQPRQSTAGVVDDGGGSRPSLRAKDIQSSADAQNAVRYDQLTGSGKSNPFTKPDISEAVKGIVQESSIAADNLLDMEEQFEVLQEEQRNTDPNFIAGIDKKIDELSSKIVLARKVVEESKSIVESQISKDVDSEMSGDIGGLTQTRSGFDEASPDGIAKAAKKIVDKYGDPSDDLYATVYNRLEQAADAKVAEKEVMANYKAMAKPILDSIGAKRDSVYASYESEFAKNSQAIDSIRVKAGREMDAELSTLNDRFTGQVNSIDLSLKDQETRLNDYYKSLTGEVESGRMTTDEANSALSQAQIAYNSSVEERNRQVQEIQAGYSAESNKLQSRYNAQFYQQQQGILKDVERRVAEAQDAYSKAVKISPEDAKKLRSLYGEAWTKTMKDRVGRKENMDEAQYSALSTINPQAAFAAWFGKSMLSGIGGSIKRTSVSLGSRSGYTLGSELERAFLRSEPSTKEFKDLLDARNLAGISGQLAGGMLPSLIAAGGVSAITGGAGAGVGAQLVGSALAGWATESLDIAGGIRDQVYRETNDAKKADYAAHKAWVSQAQLLPTYAFEGLPFIGKALKGISNRALRMGVGGAIEYTTELFQEIPQNIAEDNIVSGRPAWENFGDKLMGPQTKETMIQMIPLVALGASGHISSPGQDIERAAKSYMAKSSVAEKSDGLAAQWINSMVQANGDNFAGAVIEGLKNSGHISPSEAMRLDLIRQEVGSNMADAKQVGLSNEDSQVYTSFRSKARDIQRKADEASSPDLKKYYEGQAKEMDATADSFLSGDGAEYVKVKYADGSSSLLSIKEANSLLTDPDFIAKAALLDNDLEISGFGEESTSMLDEFFSKVDRAHGAQAAFALDPSNAQITMVEKKAALKEDVDNAIAESETPKKEVSSQNEGGKEGAKPTLVPAKQSVGGIDGAGVVADSESIQGNEAQAPTDKSEATSVQDVQPKAVKTDLTEDIPDDPKALAMAYYEDHLAWNSDENPEYAMQQALAGRVSGKSYDEFGDPNNRTASMAKFYFAKKDERHGAKTSYGLDQIAQELSESLGKEVTPGDLVAFMDANPSGIPRTSPRMRQSQERYKGLTGKKLDKATGARMLAKQGKGAVKDPTVREYIDGHTDQEGNVNWQSIKDEAHALGFLGYTDEQAANILAEADRNLGIANPGTGEVLAAVSKDESNAGRSSKREAEKVTNDQTPPNSKAKGPGDRSASTPSDGEVVRPTKVADELSKPDQERQALTEQVAKAKADRDKFKKDFTKRAETLFDKSEVATKKKAAEPSMFEAEGDTRANSTDDFKKAVRPYDDAISKAEKDLADHDSKAGDRVKAEEAQTRVDESAKKVDEIDEALKGLKFHKGGQLSAATPFTLAWDAAIDAVRLARKGGLKLAEAIEHGIAKIRDSEWYKNLGKKEQKDAEQDFRVKLHIEPLKSKLKPTQVKALVSRGTKARTEAQQRAFGRYAERVRENAEHVDKVEAADDIRSGIKGKLKSKDALKKNTKEQIGLFKQFATLDPSKVNDIDAHTEMAQRIKDALIGIKVKDGAVENAGLSINNDEVTNYLGKEIIAQREQAKQDLLDQYDQMVKDGILSGDLSLDQMQEVINASEEDIDGVLEKVGAEDKLNTLRDFAEAKIGAMSIGIHTANTVLEAKVLDDILNIDPQKLSAKELVRLNNTLNNIQVNGDYSGSGPMAAIGVEHQNVKELLKVVNGIKVQEASEGWDKMRTEAARMDAMTLDNKASSEARRLMGSDAYGDASHRVHALGEDNLREAEQEMKRVGLKAKDDTQPNRNLMFVYSWVIQNEGGTPAQTKAFFENQKDMVRKSIERLTHPSASEENKQKGAIMAEAFKIAEDAKTPEEVRANLDKINPGFGKLVDWAVNKGNEVQDKSFENKAINDNEVPKVVNNWTHAKQRSLLRTNVDDLGKNTFVGKNLDRSGSKSMISRANSLGQGRVLDGDFITNLLEGWHQNNYANETQAERMVMERMLNNPEVINALGQHNVEILRQQAKRKTDGDKSSAQPLSKTEKKAMRAAHRIIKMGAGIALKSVTQIIKQPIVLSNVATVLGAKNLDLLARPMDDLRDVMRGRMITGRGEYMAGIEPTGRTITKGEAPLANTVWQGVERGLTKVADAGDKLYKPLTGADVWSATQTWKAFYLKSLRDRGLLEGADLSVPNEQAASYANHMTEKLQGSNSVTTMAQIYQARGIQGILRYLYMPFTSFSAQTRSRMVNDIQKIRLGTPEQRAEGRRGLAATAIEQATYNAAKLAIYHFTLAAARAAIQAIFNFDDDKDKDGNKVVKDEHLTSKFLQNFFEDLFMPGWPQMLKGIAEGGVNEIAQAIHPTTEDEQGNRVAYEGPAYIYDPSKYDQADLSQLGAAASAVQFAQKLYNTRDYWDGMIHENTRGGMSSYSPEDIERLTELGVNTSGSGAGKQGPERKEALELTTEEKYATMLSNVTRMLALAGFTETQLNSAMNELDKEVKRSIEKRAKINSYQIRLYPKSKGAVSTSPKTLNLRSLQN